MRIKKSYLIYLAMAVSVGLIAFSSMNQASATTYGTKGTIWKHEILVASGFWQTGNVYNPFRGDMSMPAFMMYDTMFAHNNTDPNNPQYIGIIGKSFAWNGTGTGIDVVLKDGSAAGGPKWSDGQAIDTGDFNFTYSNLGGAWDAKVSGIKITNATHATVELYANATYSQEIFDWVSRQRALVPEHIWTLIEASEGDLGLANVWHNGTFPEAWKVCSGPYKPYYAEPGVEDIFVRRDDYWGFAGLTQAEIDKKPKYIAHIGLPNNNAAATAMAEDKLDYSGQYMSQVWEITGRNENVSTWYANSTGHSYAPYYPSESSILELMFNPRKFPFTELPVRQAIAEGIDYDSVLTVAGTGYFRRARVGRIDNETTAHVPAYSAAVEAAFQIDYQPGGMEAKLDAIYGANVCYANASVGGAGLMLDLEAINASSHTGPTGNGVDPRTNALVAAGTLVDMNGGSAGVQVPLTTTTLKIDTVAAWSDFVVLADAIALDLNNNLGLPTVANKLTDGAWGGAQQSGNDGSIATYDMSMHTGSPKTQEPAYRAFAWMMGDPNTWGGNTQNWVGGSTNTTINPFYNASYKTQYDIFDTSAVYSAAYNSSALYMQTMLAEQRAAVNVGYNCMWYTVNTKWFKNWPTEGNKWLHVVPPWANYNQGAMSQMILGLETTGTVDPESLNTPLPFVPILMGLVGLAMVFALIRRRKN